MMTEKGSERGMAAPFAAAEESSAEEEGRRRKSVGPDIIAERRTER